MRLIDADALLEQIDTERDILAMDGRLGTEHILVHYVREFIENAPTVDAVEIVKDMLKGEMKLMPLEVDAVRRGRWLFPFGDRRYKKCSECGRTFYSIPYDSNYCPNCGARMDGEA